MTHAELLIKIIAEQGKVSLDEARFMLASFRASFPAPESLDRELSKKEVKSMTALYRSNDQLMRSISKTMISHHKNLPSA